MKKAELVGQLRNGLFADRKTLEEAADYMYMLARRNDGQAITVLTAVGVVCNTIANEIEKLED